MNPRQKHFSLNRAASKKQIPIKFQIISLCFAAMVSSLPREAMAQTVAPYYAGTYTIRDAGSVPGVPGRYGALAFKAGDTNTLLIGGDGNTLGAAIYQVTVTRGAGNHITGFSGTAAFFASADGSGGGLDGGLAYGPGNVLFFTSYPDNQLCQIKPGQTTVAKRIDLLPYGPESVGSLVFVPAGLPGAGRLKILDYSRGDWYDATLQADLSGTYNIATISSPLLIDGSPEGAFFVAAGNPIFPNPSVLVCDYQFGAVSSFEVNANGDPIVATRRSFLTGINGAEGATRDPVTGDFVFGTFTDPGKVYVVSGFSDPLASPVVTITDPTNGQHFAAPSIFTIHATASQANGVVSRVDFYVDGALGGTDTIEPYTFEPSALALGTHQLYAVATGNSLMGTSAVVSVTITNVPNQRPQVVLTAPANGSVLPDCSITTLTASATDADGFVASVRFYNHATNLLGIDSSEPFSLLVTNFGVATNQLTAVAYDDEGLAATSAVVTVRVALLPTNHLAILRLPANTVMLCCRGIPGTNYVIESVANLLSSTNVWTPFRTNTAPALSGGEFYVLDTNATAPRRFYRARRE